MNSTCPLCGHALDATGCEACPLGSNCPMVCCPACGYTTIDTDKTMVGKLALKLAPSQVPKGEGPIGAGLTTLAEAPKGVSVRVVAVENTEGSRPLQLQAYGLAPGRLVQVLQQEPVTVVRADHTELALEGDLASKVLVEVVTP
jgi:Fe2+ transport system protein FeoA